MRIFCTNDDGVASVGLAVLADRLGRDGASVVIGAPDCDMSGCGTAIQRHDIRSQLWVARHTYDGYPDVEAHAVSATPAMTAILAERGVFGAPPDLVMSGPNFGANVGTDLMHSGTVAAASTAARRGIPGVAVSLALDFTRAREVEPNWATAAEVAAAVVQVLGGLEFDLPVLVNVNVPDVAPDALRGVRHVVPADGSHYHFLGFEETVDSDGVRHLAPRFEADQLTDVDTDVGALRAGFATLTHLAAGGMRPLDDAAGLAAAVAERLGAPVDASFDRRGLA